ncbi:MAG: winged helix-turn-helix transcriptional regulator [Methanobacteriota archaeon]|nr:MAG: winged helix-turn-helix transcriptional regulator [Euryarchaeota archaeon]
MRVELNKKSIFALASDTRLEILKSLKPMRRTVSQLSEELEIDKGAIHRHLKKMEEGGLVKRYEDHGFVYYGLTWMARDLIVPNENTRVVIVLSATWLLSLAFAFLLIATLMSESGNDALMDFLPLGDGTEQTSRYDMMEVDSPTSGMLLPIVVTGVAVAVLCVAVVRMVWTPLQKPADDTDGAADVGDGDGAG